MDPQVISFNPLTQKEREHQRGRNTCPKLHSRFVENPRLKHEFSSSPELVQDGIKLLSFEAFFFEVRG